MRQTRILKSGSVKISDHARVPGRDAGDLEDDCEGEIEVVLRKVGDLIEAIEVVCPCGRRTEVECLYDAIDTVGDGVDEPE